jgi:hypothetical protein
MRPLAGGSPTNHAMWDYARHFPEDRIKMLASSDQSDAREGPEGWRDRMMSVWPDRHIRHSRTTSLQVSRPVLPIRSGPSDRQGGYSLASRNLASDRHRNSRHVGTQCGIEKEQVLCAPEEDGGAMLVSHGLIRFESSKNGLIPPTVAH